MEFLPTNAYSTLVLLSFTRFLCLYFVHFYEKLTRNLRVFYFIIVANLIFILIHTDYVFSYLQNDRSRYLNGTCSGAQNGVKTSSNCSLTPSDTDFVYQLYGTLFTCFNVAVNAKPLVCLAISILSAGMIVFRIGKQAAFQIKHNRKDFHNSVRISFVIVFQVLINGFLFLLELLRILWSKKNRRTDGVVVQFPSWIESLLQYGDPRMLQTFRQCRIFIESAVILLIMTGYREAIIQFLKYLYYIFRDPRSFGRKAYNGMLLRYRSSSSVIILKQ